MAAPGSLHHLEINVSSLERSLRFWAPLLERFEYTEHQVWNGGRSYIRDTTYLVFTQVDKVDGAYNRRNVGLNHLAFHAASQTQVDEITRWVKSNGYRVLYEDRHPFAGGPQHYALYCEDPDRIKVEIVAPAG
ncbi:Tn3 family transposase ISAau4 [Paraburkholderia fynbosensis]|uniref:Tn3 family transposase ISAau4 n=2 Tax=Paraburkholderia fynbosensis TaxID=1200993 RepID=A0A6J5GZV0_9BURK|nr:Tn3 family transposase ISAau4 [Paraburkholderia fynbosensis]